MYVYDCLPIAWRRSLPPGTLDPWIAVPDVQILKLQENPEVSIIHPCCNEVESKQKLSSHLRHCICLTKIFFFFARMFQLVSFLGICYFL